jgi:hypothetical protein
VWISGRRNRSRIAGRFGLEARAVSTQFTASGFKGNDMFTEAVEPDLHQVDKRYGWTKSKNKNTLVCAHHIDGFFHCLAVDDSNAWVRNSISVAVVRSKISPPSRIR